MCFKSVFSNILGKNVYNILHINAEWLLASCSHAFGILHLSWLSMLSFWLPLLICAVVGIIWPLPLCGLHPHEPIAKHLQRAVSMSYRMNGKCCAKEQKDMWQSVEHLCACMSLCLLMTDFCMWQLLLHLGLQHPISVPLQSFFWTYTVKRILGNLFQYTETWKF